MRRDGRFANVAGIMVSVQLMWSWMSFLLWCIMNSISVVGWACEVGFVEETVSDWIVIFANKLLLLGLLIRMNGLRWELQVDKVQ